MKRTKVVGTMLIVGIVNLSLGVFIGAQGIKRSHSLSVGNLISYQGKLVDAQGKPTTSTSADFRIYEDGRLVWQQLNASISPSNGVFSAFLDVSHGNTTNGGPLIFDPTREYTLGVTVKGFAEMKQRFTSVPLSQVAVRAQIAQEVDGRVSVVTAAGGAADRLVIDKGAGSPVANRITFPGDGTGWRLDVGYAKNNAVQPIASFSDTKTTSLWGPLAMWGPLVMYGGPVLNSVDDSRFPRNALYMRAGGNPPYTYYMSFPGDGSGSRFSIFSSNRSDAIIEFEDTGNTNVNGYLGVRGSLGIAGTITTPSVTEGSIQDNAVTPRKAPDLVQGRIKKTKLDLGVANAKGNGVVTVNFNMPFDSPPTIICQVIDGAIGGSAHVNVMPGSVTTSTFQVNATHNVQFFWMAAGP